MLQEGLKWLPTAGTKLTKPRPRVHIFAELCTAEGGRGLYYGMPQTLTFSSGTAEEEETRRLPRLCCGSLRRYPLARSLHWRL